MLPPNKDSHSSTSGATRRGGTGAHSGSTIRGSTKRGVNPTVLIADKSPEFALMLSHLLRKKDFDCTITYDRKSIFSIFLEKRPKIVTLSFGLEKERDGLDAAKDILNISSKTEVVILTDANSRINERAERLGVEIFLAKNAGFSMIVNSICALSNLKKSACDLVAR